jgi:LacI family transcriptional regulator
MALQVNGAPRNATRNDVARLAGVSTAVVSYVVNEGPRPVAPATRARVLAAIDKLGYRPNTAARTLITGRSDLIGLVVPDVENPYFAALAKAVVKAAAHRGLRVMLAQSLDEELPALLDSLAGHQVDGIITATLPLAYEVGRRSRAQAPTVKLSLEYTGDSMPAFWPDFHGGSQDAVRHLIEVHGHERIAFVTGAERLDGRERGWRDAMAASGLRAERVVRVPWSCEGGRLAAAEILKDPAITAVFVASDQQAIGLLAGLRALGSSVPGDLAVVSFDGSASAGYTVPGLSTAGVPFAPMATDAIDVLMGGRTPERMYPTTLVLRESCGCPPHSAGAPVPG